MATMTPPVPPFALRHHRPITTWSLALLFWAVAAVMVLTAHVVIESRWPWGGAVAALIALLLVSYCYMRLVAQDAGVSHALAVGAAWLILSTVTEIVATTQLGHAWSSLLGSPDRALVRNLYLFAWIFAPVLFARRSD